MITVLNWGQDFSGLIPCKINGTKWNNNYKTERESCSLIHLLIQIVTEQLRGATLCTDMGIQYRIRQI